MTASDTMTRTIRCTEHNAADFQRMVKQTPELLDMVQFLQKQNMFPGLRAMTITLTGKPELVAKGLEGVPEIFKTGSIVR